MKKNIISTLEWAKKNNLSVRHTRRLIGQGEIPTEKMAVYIMGVPENFKLKRNIH